MANGRKTNSMTLKVGVTAHLSFFVKGDIYYEQIRRVKSKS